jgi:hypothetical protein
LKISALMVPLRIFTEIKINIFMQHITFSKLWVWRCDEALVFPGRFSLTRIVCEILQDCTASHFETKFCKFSLSAKY